MSRKTTKALLRRAASAQLLRDNEESQMKRVAQRRFQLVASVRELDNEIGELENRLVEEAVASASDPKLIQHFPSFVASVRAVIEARKAERSKIAADLATVQVEFGHALRRTKTYEVAADQAKKHVRLNEKQAEARRRLEDMIQRAGRK